MITKKLLYSLLIFATAAPSCAYLRDRGRDAARMIEFDAGTTTGLQVHAGFSHLLEAGAGYYEGKRYGLREGDFIIVEEARAEFGLPIFYLHEVDQHTLSGAMPARSVARPLDAGYIRYPLQWFSPQITDREVADFNISLNFIFVGASLTIKPVAIVDFFFGIVGTDLRRDDLSKYTVADLLPQLHSADPLERRRAVQLLERLTGRRFEQYRTSPSREVFTNSERAAILQIEQELSGGAKSPSAPRTLANAVSASARDAMPEPVEATPASRPSIEKK